ncbi:MULTISPECIES: DUF6153 family protein [Streptomyces]|uniref:DUF6153 family protein n=1 Tax=Streptomyces TaxID=1883 RepID=UPI001FED1C66|nr:DUF6153 family protein [Streptomyces roseicoloratus]
MAMFEKPLEAQRALRLKGLLVVAVLVGLLGMHAMGPGPMTAQASGATASVTAVASTFVEADREGHCDHDCSGHGGSGEHADPTCASAGVAGPVVLPALGPSLVGPVVTADGLVSTQTVAAERGRAPPSLYELQLLRI